MRGLLLSTRARPWGDKSMFKLLQCIFKAPPAAHSEPAASSGVAHPAAQPDFDFDPWLGYSWRRSDLPEAGSRPVRFRLSEPKIEHQGSGYLYELLAEPHPVLRMPCPARSRAAGAPQPDAARVVAAPRRFNVWA